MHRVHPALALAFALALAGGCDRDSGPETVEPPPETPSETPTPPGPAPTQDDVGVETGGGLPDTGRSARPTPPGDGPDLAAIIANRTAQRGRRPLEIEHFLSRGDVRELTNFAGALTEVPIEGQEIDSEYNGVRFAGEGHLGVTVQAWDMPSSAAANQRFERLRETYISAELSRTDIGDASFRSTYAGVRQFVFMNRRRSMVVALACDLQVCPSEVELDALASRVFQNM